MCMNATYKTTNDETFFSSILYIIIIMYVFCMNFILHWCSVWVVLCKYIVAVRSTHFLGTVPHVQA